MSFFVFYIYNRFYSVSHFIIDTGPSNYNILLYCNIKIKIDAQWYTARHIFKFLYNY